MTDGPDKYLGLTPNAFTETLTASTGQSNRCHATTGRLLLSHRSDSEARARETLIERKRVPL